MGEGWLQQSLRSRPIFDLACRMWVKCSLVPCISKTILSGNIDYNSFLFLLVNIISMVFFLASAIANESKDLSFGNYPLFPSTAYKIFSFSLELNNATWAMSRICLFATILEPLASSSILKTMFFFSQEIFLLLFLNFFFFYSFLREGKGGRKGGRETSTWERNIDRLPPVHAPTRDWNPGDWAHNPGMCPDWELNPRLFGLQDNAQPTEPHQPGFFLEFYFSIYPSRIPDSFGFSSYYISWLYFLALCPWSPHLCIFIPFVSCFSHMIIQNTNLVPSSDQPFTVCLSIF